MSAQTTAILRPRLDEAKKALDAALDEACDIDRQGADIATLMRLEEQLTAAREAATSVIAALRRLGAGYKEAEVPLIEPHRLFIDDSGVQWDAFVVYPSRPKGRETLPPPFDKGWLAIQCPEGVRRLTPIPEGWRECSNEEFCKLLERAAVAPRRTTAAREKHD
jgi:hypothetical protein